MSNIATISSSAIARQTFEHYFIEASDGRRRPPYFWGSPGTGKSAGVHEGARMIADEVNDPDFWILDYRTVLCDPVDIKGVPYVLAHDDDRSTRFAPPADLLRTGRGIIFCDEFAQALQSVMNALSQPILDYKIGDTPISRGILFVGASNNLTDRASAVRMPTHIRNRFMHYNVAPDLDGVLDVWNKIKIHPMVIAYIRFKSDDMYQFDPASEDQAFATLRSWEMVSDVLKSPHAERGMHQKIEACIGSGIAASFAGFLKVWRDMPDLDQVIKTPKKIAVPKDNPAACYAILGGLTMRCTEKTFEPIMTYIGRMSPEYGAAFVKDVTRRDESLCETEAFAKWAVDNHKLMSGFSAGD